MKQQTAAIKKAKAQKNRLNATGFGRQIDDQQSIDFTFDGKTYTGYAGDTLASALLANGVLLLGRSFKYHRPRGVLTANSLEPNALVQVHGADGSCIPNTRATVLRIYPGLRASSQNRFPSLAFDVMAVNRYLSPFFVAGFYYKTFMWPGLKGWMWYEKIIRRAAGLGRAGEVADTQTYEKTHCFCQVLVVGAGVSGMSAALHHAKQLGKQVLLVDEKPFLGGRLADSLDADEQALLQQLSADITAHDKITVLKQTTVFGAYDGQVFAAVTQCPPNDRPAQRFHKIAAAQVIYATGAFERPLLFKNNDLPGVMLAEALQTYLRQYAVLPGKHMVFYTTNDSVYPLAKTLADMFACQVTIVDTRPLSSILGNVGSVAKANAHPQIQCFYQARVVSASGKHRVYMAHIRSPEKEIGVACDVLAMSGGFTPNVNLQCHLGHKPDYDAEIDALVMTDQHGVTIGAAAGVWDLDSKIASAENASPEIIAKLRRNTFNHDKRTEIYALDGKAFVDFQHDVSNADIALATREGYTSVEHSKRYTTLGMATDQGKLSNFNALKLMSLAQQRPLGEVGTTTYRPPYTPVTMGALAGAKTGLKVKPTRRLPTDAWHRQAGAVYTNVGLWQRPEFYPAFAGETKGEAYLREAANVRQNVGLIDVSTLGKISVQGPDAAELVNRLYINGMKKLGVGKIRYGLMLREDGIPYDDGTVMRISDNDFLLTTTTAHAADVLRHIEHLLQVVWPDLRAIVNTATDQWASIAVAGPNSRAVLQQLLGDKVALDNTSLPFMSFVDIVHHGLALRLARISFSGELGYEIMVGANYGDNLWRALLSAGKAFNIAPYGTEAMGALRIEKGFITHAEMDGRVTVHQLGMTRMLSRLKADFIGKYYAENRRTDVTGEPQLVGLQAIDNSQRLAPGYHLVGDDSLAPQPSQGWVSSTTWSTALNEYIALGFLTDGRQRLGETVYAISPLEGKSVAMRVVAPQFFDPSGQIAAEKDRTQQITEKKA